MHHRENSGQTALGTAWEVELVCWQNTLHKCMFMFYSCENTRLASSLHNYKSPKYLLKKVYYGSQIIRILEFSRKVSTYTVGQTYLGKSVFSPIRFHYSFLISQKSSCFAAAWDLAGSQCPPNISLPVGLKEVQTQLVSFCVTRIFRTPSTLKPQDEVFVRYWQNLVGEHFWNC